MNATDYRRNAAWRKAVYLRELHNRNVPSSDPDYSACDAADELEVVRYGGDVHRWRELGATASLPSEDVAGEKALTAALSALGVKVDPEVASKAGTAADGLGFEDELRIRRLGLDPRLSTVTDARDLSEKRASWAQSTNGPTRR